MHLHMWGQWTWPTSLRLLLFNRFHLILFGFSVVFNGFIGKTMQSWKFLWYKWVQVPNLCLYWMNDENDKRNTVGIEPKLPNYKSKTMTTKLWVILMLKYLKAKYQNVKMLKHSIMLQIVDLKIVKIFKPVIYTGLSEIATT